MSENSVLIVGAGPTGLFMACELARHGIPFRIIDRKSERTLTSNAVWMQTRTVEIFDEVGVVDRFLRVGQFCKAVNVYVHNKSIFKLCFDSLKSIYKFVLMISQSDTELILNTRLEEFGYQVERGVELSSIDIIGNSTQVSFKHADGEDESATFDWVIACDGANSTIREKCKLGFPGEDLTEQFIVADAQMDSFLRSDEVHAFLDKGTVLAAFPIGGNKYRLNANLHLTHARKLFTEKEVKEIVIDRAYGDYNVESVAWISSFWIHSKTVTNMRHQSIFLVGDAAHIHSPSIGQGMNAGLQDAYNLAWKLALVIKGDAKPTLLNTYQLERYPIIKSIVDSSERFTAVILTENYFKIIMRNFIFKCLNIFKSYSSILAQQLTQLSIRYNNSPIINYTGKRNSHSPQPGERAPNVIIDKSKRLLDYLRDSKHNVLLFAGNASKEQISGFSELLKLLEKKYTSLLKVNIISINQSVDMENVILDSSSIIHQTYHIAKPTIYIVRPDNYIAYCSSNFDIESIEGVMSSYFN